MLAGTAALHRLVVSGTSEAGSHNDFGTVQGGIKLFQLLHQSIGHTELVLFSALTAELTGVEMRCNLHGIGILILHFSSSSILSIIS